METIVLKKQRKHYTPEEKVAIPRRHLVEGVPISEPCDDLGLQPTVFYRWQKEFFENGAAAFRQKGRPSHPVQERITYLEKKVQTKDEVLAELMVPHDTRDQIVDFVRRRSQKAGIGAGRFIPWLGITASKFYDWRERYSKVNEHNGWLPRNFWLEGWEKQAIVKRGFVLLISAKTGMGSGRDAATVHQCFPSDTRSGKTRGLHQRVLHQRNSYLDATIEQERKNALRQTTLAHALPDGLAHEFTRSRVCRMSLSSWTAFR